MPYTPNSAHIVAVFNVATSAEREHGRSWYRMARDLAHTLDAEHPERAAGVIAAVSPLTPWDRNVELAKMAYRDGKASKTLSRNVDKANRIMAGEDPLDVLSGDKVRNFYLCIADPYSDGICIDRHAYDVAVGRVTGDAERSTLSRKGRYADFQREYVRAAVEISWLTGEIWSASMVQAATWVTWRRIKSEK